MRYTTSTDHQCPACGYTERKSKKRSESVDAKPHVEFYGATAIPVTVSRDYQAPPITAPPIVKGDGRVALFQCQDCDRTSPTLAGLKAHQRAAHKQAAEV